jgi:cytoskeleton protein RodZ
MASDGPAGGLEIGAVLRDARQRAGLDIGTVEARTKIRTRYLRALENEEWDVLPGHAYAKGFLRTYAQLLGLDADALVDEYRRRVEVPTGQYPIAEPVLQARRRGEEPGEPGLLGRAPSRGWILGGLLTALVAILVVLGLTAGEDDESGRAERESNRDRQEEQEQGQPEPPPPLPLELTGGTSPVQVCLLRGDGEVLLDDTLEPGESEQFDSYTYELRFPDGFDTDQIELAAGGEPLEIEIDPQGPVAYLVEPPGRLTQMELASEGCP